MTNSGLPLMFVNLKPDGTGATVFCTEPAINMTLREQELMIETAPEALQRGLRRLGIGDLKTEMAENAEAPGQKWRRGFNEQVNSPHKRRKGRPPNPLWEKAKPVAMKWLSDNGYPSPGDGEQTELEKYISDFLAARDYFPAESTRRNYVSGWISEYKEELGVPGLQRSAERPSH